MMEDRVFLLDSARDARYQTDSASEHGSLVFLNIETSMFSPTEFGREVLEKLEENAFNPDRDSIALTGPMLAVTLLLGSAAARYGFVDVLIFQANACRYRRRLFDVGI